MTSDIIKVQLNDVGTIFRVRILEDDGVTIVPLQASVTKQIIFTKPDETSVTKDADFYSDGSDGYIEYVSVAGDLDQTGVWYLQGFVTFAHQSWHTTADAFLVEDDTETSIEYLLPLLRLRLGDVDSASYRYMDEWLVLSLIASVRSLERYWDSKYLISDGGVITRNPDYDEFQFDTTNGVVQTKDEIIIILKAAIVVLEGSLENYAWNLGSWRDAEVSYSNIASGGTRDASLKRLHDELDLYLKAPMKRLTISSRRTIDNTYL